MNEYQRFIQRELDRHGWKPAQIEKRGGPSRQLVSKILSSKSAVLEQRPSQETIEGFARAFGVSVEVVLAHVGLAMGIPVALESADLDKATDDELLTEIRKRMQRESGHNEQRDDPTPPTPLFPVEDADGQDAGEEQKIERAAHTNYDPEIGPEDTPNEV